MSDLFLLEEFIKEALLDEARKKRKKRKKRKSKKKSSAKRKLLNIIQIIVHLKGLKEQSN